MVLRCRDNCRENICLFCCKLVHSECRIIQTWTAEPNF